MIAYLYNIMVKVGITKGQDKVLHFGVGFTVGLVLAIFVSPSIGAIVGAVLGLAKELYDQYKYDGFDFFDLFTTIFGAWTGIFAYGLFIA